MKVCGLLVLWLAAALLPSTIVHADTIQAPIDFSHLFNGTQGRYSGYSIPNGNVTLGGIPFELATDPINQLSTWDSNRQMYVQVLDASDGSAVSSPIAVDVEGNRFHELKPYPDGSVAYAAPGSSSSTIEIMRVMPCE